MTGLPQLQAAMTSVATPRREVSLAMEFVGFFRELDPGGPTDIYVEDLKDAAGAGDYAVAEVAGYLESGYPILDVMESTPDPLDKAAYVRGGPSLLTDGEWVWRHDLAHYVRNYRVHLPGAFMERMEESEFEVRAVDLEALRLLSVAAIERLGYQ